MYISLSCDVVYNFSTIGWHIFCIVYSHLFLYNCFSIIRDSQIIWFSIMQLDSLLIIFLSVFLTIYFKLDFALCVIGDTCVAQHDNTRTSGFAPEWLFLYR